jgi:hypothetical protein
MGEVHRGVHWRPLDTDRLPGGSENGHNLIQQPAGWIPNSSQPAARNPSHSGRDCSEIGSS